MTARIGMDPGMIRGLADQLDRMADDLANLVGRVSGGVNRLGGTWRGADFDQLAHTWHGRNAAAITAIVGEVRRMATTARQNAAEQEQASGVNGDIPSGWRLGEGGLNLDDARNFAMAATDLGITVVQLEQLGKQLGIPLREWEPGVLNHLDDATKLAKFGHALGVFGVAVDWAQVDIAAAHGEGISTIVGKSAIAALDSVGVAVPEVGLAIGAYQVGATIGTAIAGSPAGQHVQYEALNVGASYIHGDPYTDPQAADDLVKRYEGAGGFINAMHDSIAGLFH